MKDGPVHGPEPKWRLPQLTPEEIEDLRRDKKETSALAQKAFARLRPKTA